MRSVCSIVNTISVATGVMSPSMEQRKATMLTFLPAILIFMIMAVAPAWPHSRAWGYYPSGALGVVLLVFVVLLISGKLDGRRRNP